MIITGFIYKPEHKASVLKISEGRRRRGEKFNKSQRGTKLPSLILKHLFPAKAQMRAGTRYLGSLLITPDLYKGWIDGSLRTFFTVRLSLLIPDFSVLCHFLKAWRTFLGAFFHLSLSDPQVSILVSIQMQSHSGDTEQLFKVRFFSPTPSELFQQLTWPISIVLPSIIL